MKQFIGIEDLAGNALIELLRANGKRKVSFKQLKEYRTKVRQYLREQGNEEVILLYNESAIVAMKTNYADFFEVKNFGKTNAYIKLKKDINIMDLWLCFRSPFPIKTMQAFMDENVLTDSGLIVA